MRGATTNKPKTGKISDFTVAIFVIHSSKWTRKGVEFLRPRIEALFCDFHDSRINEAGCNRFNRSFFDQPASREAREEKRARRCEKSGTRALCALATVATSRGSLMEHLSITRRTSKTTPIYFSRGPLLRRLPSRGQPGWIEDFSEFHLSASKLVSIRKFKLFESEFSR